MAYHFALGVLVGIIPFLFRQRFYFHDDMQTHFMPTFYHIGRLLRDGEFPLLTSTSWYASNVLGEYQFALFNPVSLSVYALLPSIPNFHWASLLLACFYYGVLTSGAYVLARSYGIERHWASLTALVLACNNYLAYWNASNWFPIFVSIAWLVWAWAFLERANHTRIEWLLAVMFSYLAITAGAPHTTIVLGLVGALAAWRHWRTSGLAAALAAPAALAAATLFALLPLLAILSLGELSNRPSGIFNNNFLVPNLRDVLAVSSPFHLGYIKAWRGYELDNTPFFFVAWFIIPLLPLMDWKSIDWRRSEVLSLGALTALLLLATQGPEYLTFIRFPFRWLPYLQLSLVIFFCALAAGASFLSTPSRVLGAVALIGLLFISSVQTSPQLWKLHLAGALASLVGLGFFIAVPGRRQWLRVGVLAAVTLAFLVGTRARVTINTSVTDLGVPPEAAEAPDHPWRMIPSAYGIFLGFDPSGDPDRLREFPVRSTGLETGTPMVNGYTGIWHLPLSRMLCMTEFGSTCPDAGPRLFQRDRETGLLLADLFKIDRIIALKGPHLHAVRPFVAGSWRLDDDGRYAQRFVRALPAESLPGTLSWTSPGVRVQARGTPRNKRETLSVSNPAEAPARLVFSRLWWPGYRAELNGVRVPVSAHLGVFVAVDLPPGANGELTLKFLPPGLRLGLAAAAIGLMLVLGMLGLHGGLSRARRRAEFQTAPS